MQILGAIIKTEFFLAIAAAGGVVFLGCPSVRPIIVNAISLERLEGISSNLAQTSTWTQG